MAMSILKRYSSSFTHAGSASTPSPAVDKPHPTGAPFKQDSFSKKLHGFAFTKPIRIPLHKRSHDDTAQIIDASDVAVHAAYREKDTTAAQKEKARKAHMTTKSRVQSLRDFFGIASPAFDALEDSEKEEYQTWHAYVMQEKEMRQRYEEIAQEPADIEVMLRGWRVDHPPPRLSGLVLTLVTEESAAQSSGISRSGYSELPPFSRDIIWNSIVLIPTPPSSVSCQICGKSRNPGRIAFYGRGYHIVATGDALGVIPCLEPLLHYEFRVLRPSRHAHLSATVWLLLKDAIVVTAHTGVDQTTQVIAIKSCSPDDLLVLLSVVQDNLQSVIK
ncbi:hypothetical protein P171DRAFT_524540 [Karstenula rhodostoma CBS 690.94]|uniref:Uncharacterized protein n=1 Tax=Karstenula rhodostoma CBS 690.94 TaxID=1392251 RepID=A0A9P4U7U6_9PLEO|nr:hypothetical protein P171DRAFT_524540 [Karstenula rhodostoma CBS 690.94]